ncbi:hypothetical protein D3C84_866680 [compost metagenome]
MPWQPSWGKGLAQEVGQFGSMVGAADRRDRGHFVGCQRGGIPGGQRTLAVADQVDPGGTGAGQDPIDLRQ